MIDLSEWVLTFYCLSNYAFEYYLINKTNNYGLIALILAFINAVVDNDAVNKFIFPFNKNLK